MNKTTHAPLTELVVAVCPENIDKSPVLIRSEFPPEAGSAVQPNRTALSRLAKRSPIATKPCRRWTFASATCRLLLVLLTAVSSVLSARAQYPPGTGLRGEYFNDMDLTELALTRIDPQVDFAWGEGSPDPSMKENSFSVRWTGYLIPRYSQNYEFRTDSDDGVRLWLDEQMVIGNWTDHDYTTDKGLIALQAGRAYRIQLEFYENTGDADIRLLWSSPSQPEEIIPTSQLHPDPVQSRPRLQVERKKDKTVEISWSLAFEDNQLQASPNLFPGEWHPVTEGVQFDEQRATVQIPADSTDRYFRLWRQLRPRAIFPKPEHTEVDPKRALPSQIVLKFHEGSRVRHDGVRLTFDLDRLTGDDRALLSRVGLNEEKVAADVGAVNQLIAEFTNPPNQSQILLGRMFPKRSQEQLDQDKAEGELATGEELADLGLYYLIMFPEATAEWASITVDKLNALASIETAYPQARFEAADIPPTTTINLEGSQGYLQPAPLGIDAQFAWGFRGGRGRGTRVIDIEANWHENHEDLPLRGPFYRDGIADDWFDSNNGEHGTSVLGVMLGVDNGFGVTGITPDAEFGLGAIVTAWYSFPFDTAVGWAAAVLNAGDALRPGDVILIEQHSPYGPDSGQSCPCNCAQFEYVPVEYHQDVFDAIRAVTARGIIVVEAAGNGSMNLDNPIYGGRFQRSLRDSRAIMVGASPGNGSLDTACFSNFGTRVDLHGWGDFVATLGGGDRRANGNDRLQWYRTRFSGTSSASPIVVGAINCVQGIRRATGQRVLSGPEIVSVLRATGTPGINSTRRIGPLPDLRRAMPSFVTEDAMFLSHMVPSRVAPGERFVAALTFLNTGRTSWNFSSGYALGSENPVGNNNWGLSSLPVPGRVRPGGRATFLFTAEAPLVPGLYNFQWRMNHAGVGSFGGRSPNVAIQVSHGQPDLIITSLIRRAQPFVDPSGFVAVPVSLVVSNAGSAAAPNFKLSADFMSLPSGARLPGRITAPGTTDPHYAWTTNPLAAASSRTLQATLWVPASLRGRAVRMWVAADSCAGEEFAPVNCRVDESNETNNESVPLDLTLP